MSDDICVMASQEFEQIKDSLTQLTGIFDSKLERIEKQRDSDAVQQEKSHAANVMLLNQLNTNVNQLQRVLATIVGEPGTNIDGRLGTMQQNLKETENRLREEIREVENRGDSRQEKLELAVKTLSERFGSLGWKLLIMAIGVFVTFVLSLITLLLRKGP